MGNLVPQGLSELTQIKMLLEMIATQGFPGSRPRVSVLDVDVFGGTADPGGQLLNAQLIGIVGFDGSGTIISGSALFDELDSIVNATDEERVYITSAMKSGFGLLSSAQLIFFILSSQDIYLELDPATTVVKLQFYYLAPTYLVNP